jgi:hypothetical protein
MAHLLIFGGLAFTVAVFREAENRRPKPASAMTNLDRDMRCVWKLESEA